MQRHTSSKWQLALLLMTAALAACGGSGGGGADGSSNSPPPSSGPPPPPSSPPPATPPPDPQATVTYLHTFQSDPNDGGEPNGPLIQASDGNFYGTTRRGGVNSCHGMMPCGVIFRLTPEGVESVMHSFGATATDGYMPSGPLMQAQDGALYGVTANGGDHGGGTVFRIALTGDYTVLHSFGATPTDGVAPVGGLVQADDGNLYGVTASGGANHCFQIPLSGGNCGTVFKMTLAGEVSILSSFGSSIDDGVTPNGPLVQASDGNLYGTTLNGGANDCGIAFGTHNCGTIFRITPAGDASIMHSFGTSRADGVAPQGSLLRASDGTFYGTTVSGGDDGNGTVFRMTLAGEVTILHTFSRSSLENGLGPSPQLIEASDGNIYGTTGSGGELGDSMAGTAFRLSPSGGLTTLFSFEPPESPHNPVGGLVQGIDGAFYGLTNYSGSAGGGTAFKLVVQ